MKKIGFVDLYIDEWHANNYPAWIKEICENQGYDMTFSYVWAERDLPPYAGKNTDEWCAAYGVERCASIDELCEKSDYIFVLSPSNPEKHLEYAEAVLKYGKNTYIDKTFAPDLKTAREIYAVAEKYGAKIFSSSALRYSSELEDLKGVSTSVTTLGGGGNLDEYIIHQIEMVVKTLNAKATALRLEKQDGEYICKIAFEGGKQATMIYSEFLPFAVNAFGADGKSAFRIIGSEFFKALLADILRFFKTGEVSFEKEQTFEVMKIREAVVNAKNSLGEWLQI